MGSFLFKWDHPASEVYVTGTFDDWGRTVKLEKRGGSFEKRVDLPKAVKTYYKFVVDGTWTTDHTAPQETDEHSNVNNVLEPKHMEMKPPALGGAFVSGVTPQSTTAQLAGQVPKENIKRDSESSPPETPFHDAQEFSVNPIPATSGIGNPISLRPGEKVPDSSTLTSNTVDSTVTMDKASYENGSNAQDFSVIPIPATSGIGNPISLKPGEKVPDPSTLTSNTVDSTVTTDKASYENGPAAPTSGNAPPAIQGGLFGVPPVTKSTIPESSLPMGGTGSTEQDAGPVLQSAGPGTTTAALAGQVPLEPRGVPEIVTESQQEAGTGPEASANPEAVKEKAAVENELEKKVPEEAPTSTSGGAGTAIASTVPDTVQKSIADSSQSPEAAADQKKVAEKSQVEGELLKTTQPAEQTGTPAPTESAALNATAPATTPAKLTDDKSRQESRDISPMSHPGGPSVTSGVASGSTPSKSTAANSSASAEKKSKRSSGFFGKLKSKFEHKDKK